MKARHSVHRQKVSDEIYLFYCVSLIRTCQSYQLLDGNFLSLANQTCALLLLFFVSEPYHPIAAPYCTQRHPLTHNLPDSLGHVRIGTSPPFPFLVQLVPGPGLSVLGYRRVFYGGLS
jgi:hypothetical protein